MKEVRHVVGMRSGTSVDGVDAALVEISGTDSEPKVKLLAFENKPYPPQVREKIFSLFTPANATVDKVGYMNFLLGEIYAKSALSVIEKAGMKPEEIDRAAFEGELYTAGLPDVDLLIRTSGEMRLSNFLLYQLAYAEFYQTDTLWPDFDRHAYDEALLAFAKRNRRFGGV